MPFLGGSIKESLLIQSMNQAKGCERLFLVFIYGNDSITSAGIETSPHILEKPLTLIVF